MGIRRFVAAVALLASVAACSGDRPDPAALPDPCGLITDDVLARIAPGSERTPDANVGDQDGRRSCEVDLTSGTGSLRGDLAVEVEADGSDSYDEKWQSDRCAQFGATPSAEGPGDISCVTVSPWDGSQTRIDGWAWVGDDYAARVAYQMVQPQTLPAGTEQDLRALLAAAVDALPTG
jgi:hypothetical protein